LLLFSPVLASTAAAQEQSPPDVIRTSVGDPTITFIDHGPLLFTFGGKVIHVDPSSKLADYGTLPKADIIPITHEHRVGDTENVPEMKALRSIDIAFLPMNLPYTMTPEMVEDTAKLFT
jgi:L-ascorbate metabolism protein UlaG (beta-lactamase superfamily)